MAAMDASHEVLSLAAAWPLVVPPQPHLAFCGMAIIRRVTATAAISLVRMNQSSFRWLVYIPHNASDRQIFPVI
jgi:hypothetical protein